MLATVEPPAVTLAPLTPVPRTPVPRTPVPLAPAPVVAVPVVAVPASAVPAPAVPAPAVPVGWRSERAYREESDVALVRRSRDGDQVAFGVLLDRHRAGLRTLCRRYLRDPHDQDELLQEVMIKAWRRIGQFDERSTVGSWLYRIVANAAVDEYRRQGRAPVPVDPGLESTWRPYDSPESAVVDQSHLRWALALLPARYRVVSVLADRLGYGSAEIAELCGIPEATVRTRLWRARRALRDRLTLADPT